MRRPAKGHRREVGEELQDEGRVRRDRGVGGGIHAGLAARVATGARSGYPALGSHGSELLAVLLVLPSAELLAFGEEDLRQVDDNPDVLAASESGDAEDQGRRPPLRDPLRDELHAVTR